MTSVIVANDSRGLEVSPIAQVQTAAEDGNFHNFVGSMLSDWCYSLWYLHWCEV